MSVELRATTEVDGQVVWCTENTAECSYSVYMGEPGDFLWIADFAFYDDALNWAEEVADCNETELIDHVQLERKS
jgi:hypothetical protein